MMAPQSPTEPVEPPQDLWLKALGRLDEPLKSRLNYSEANKKNVVAVALTVAQEKKQLCIKKRWKFTKANGDVIVLRDIIDKIIAWLDKFKVLGDLAMQYDVSHASLAWAAMRFVLQVAVSDKHAFGATLEGLETLSRLISRYAIFEELYLQQASMPRTHLEAILIDMYAEVLKYLAKARQYFETATAVRMLKSATQPHEDVQMRTILSIEGKISSLANLVDAERQLDASQHIANALNLLKSFEAPINRLTNQAEVICKHLQEEKHLSMLRWISSIPFPRHHERISGNRVPGTGEWLLADPSYVEWKKSSSSSILILQGIMGSGKTCLTSNVIDSFLAEKPHHALPVPFAYFYCARNAFEPGRADPDEIMRSLVRQMTFGSNERSVRGTLVTEYDRREAEAKFDGFDLPRLSAKECVKLILDITWSNPAIIIIDGIDEVQEARRHELIDCLIHISEEAANVVKIFISTRDVIQSTMIFPGAKTIRVHGQNARSDMQLFVQQQIDEAIRCKRLLSDQISEDLRQELEANLLNGAKDMWVANSFF